MLPAYSRLHGKINTLLDYYYHTLEVRATRSQWEIMYCSEGLISHLWQAWNRFCRAVIMESCSGANTRIGQSVASRMGDNSWGRIGYEARQAARGNGVSASGTIRSIRQEPTWGDQDKLIDVIKVVNPNNKNTLLSGFGMSLHGPKHTQIIRNACAHINHENMQDIRNILQYYNNTTIKHPSLLIWEIKKGTVPVKAYESWSRDLLNIAGAVTFQP